MKPENVLMDEKGYLLLADFGLAKVIKEDGLTRTLCGTAEYLGESVVLQI